MNAADLARRPLKAGKFADDGAGGTYMVLSITGEEARVESVITHEVYRVHVSKLTRAVMLEEIS